MKLNDIKIRIKDKSSYDTTLDSCNAAILNYITEDLKFNKSTTLIIEPEKSSNYTFSKDEKEFIELISKLCRLEDSIEITDKKITLKVPSDINVKRVKFLLFTFRNGGDVSDLRPREYINNVLKMHKAGIRFHEALLFSSILHMSYHGNSIARNKFFSSKYMLKIGSREELRKSLDVSSENDLCTAMKRDVYVFKSSSADVLNHLEIRELIEKYAFKGKGKKIREALCR